MLVLAARLFSNEQLVNPSWEPLSMKGLRFGPGPAGKVRPRRLPAVDEAIILFGVSLLLLFYVSPEWRARGLFAQLLGNELLLILAPALLFALVARWNWRETFALRPARVAALAGGALLGAGLAPWVQLVMVLQNMVWPGESETSQATTKLIVAALKAHPYLTIVGVGLLAGVCEELFYRGPLQTAFVRKLPPMAGIILVGVLFGAIHMDVHGLPVRAALGILLGWIVWRTGSIYPAMVAHGVYDSTSIAMFYAALRTHGEKILTTQPAGFHLERSDLVALSLGAAAVVVGAGLFAVANRRRRPSPAPPGTP
jgi:membrane protease YdiL (CAAX protease family)